MAFIAGAGNPTGGSNPSGTGSSINYIGEHAFGYSGSVSVNNVVSTMLDFTTASNSYILGKVAFFSDIINNDDYQLIIKFDGEAVMQQKVPQTYQSTATGYYPVELIIAPQTHVEITLANVTDTTASDWTVTFTGRQYA